MTTLTTQQRVLYDKVTRARDEVAYAYWKSQTARPGPDSTSAARELATARVHFTTALSNLIESIRNEHRDTAKPA